MIFPTGAWVWGWPVVVSCMGVYKIKDFADFGVKI